jgi:peptidyl-prolyl cis-trans isomerase A (cyclophilin A)
MARLCAALLALLLMALPVPAAPPRPPTRPIVNVALRTTLGEIVIALEMRRAPITAGNFLAYVEQGKFNGTSFYRAARAPSNPKVGLIQGGIDHDLRRSLFPIAHEPTSKTGLRHTDGTLSMARNAPGTAMGDFFITVGPAPRLDAAPNGYVGYAAFGHVVKGMDIVRRIMALPTYPGGRSFMTMGQSIRQRVIIVSARRLP